MARDRKRIKGSGQRQKEDKGQWPIDRKRIKGSGQRQDEDKGQWPETGRDSSSRAVH